MNKILSLPLRVLRRIAATIMGRNTAPPADAPPPPRRTPRPKATPPPPPSGDHGHSHEHGHDHDHGHTEPAPAVEDHGHSHGHDHDHGHTEPAPAPVVDHGHSHDHAEPAAVEKPKKAAAKKKAPTVRSEETPNPNAHKYVVGQKVVEKGSLSFSSASEAKDHPLGHALFAVKGVASIFAVNDFVTVTRTPDADWTALDAAVITAISRTL